MSDAASNNVKGEFDGIVATASHLFVIEAKLHAKVGSHIDPRYVLVPFHIKELIVSIFHTRVIQVVDVYSVLENMDLLRNPKIQPPIVHADDPRLQKVIGVLATSDVPDQALVEKARKFDVWLLAWDGSDFSLTPPTLSHSQVLEGTGENVVVDGQMLG